MEGARRGEEVRWRKQERDGSSSGVQDGYSSGCLVLSTGGSLAHSEAHPLISKWSKEN